jgi:pimeloyl-CoA dehydrogenase large subunit
VDFDFSPEEQAFRQEVREYIRANLPAETRRKMIAGRPLTRDELVEWQRILNRKHWATPSWPKEYGGPGWTITQRYIFLDELYQAPAPEPLSFNVAMLGPVLIQFGTEEQKKHFLPRIANIDDFWCQGFSEPGAGSDLAALKTSARREGDHYVVNGQKIWQGQGHKANWMFTLVRTDASGKKQQGITFLLIDMKSPGITVRPIITIDGYHEVNEVFLDNVKVPVANLVGEENKGWDVAKFLLGNERTNIARVGISKDRIRRIKQLAAQVKVGDHTLLDEPHFREKVAALEVDLQALEVTQLRVLAGQAKNTSGKPDPASSILKIKGSELRQATSELLLEVAGPLGVRVAPYDEERGTELEESELLETLEWTAGIAPSYFTLRAATIYGGASEVQKNIIAKTILGM